MDPLKLIDGAQGAIVIGAAIIIGFVIWFKQKRSGRRPR